MDRRALLAMTVFRVLGCCVCAKAGFIKAHADLPVWPDHHRALDDAGLGQHQGDGGAVVDHGGAGGFVKLAPGRSLAVQQHWRADLRQPVPQQLGGHTLLFEIMKLVGKRLPGEPGAGFFDGVAIGNAVNSEDGVFHGLHHAINGE